jgi:hypothetical protein
MEVTGEVLAEIAATVVVALRVVGAAAAQAATVSSLTVTNSPFAGLTWDTVPSGGATAFVKQGGGF